MTTAPKKLPKRGLMAKALAGMASGECLISDRHVETMLLPLLSQAEQVSDPTEAWAEVRAEVMGSWGWEDSPEGPNKPFIYQDGVAVIPIHGVLLNRFNYCWGFVTGYDFVRKQMNLAEADADVRLIVFDHDTPGGDAAGCSELADEMAALETATMALVNTSSCSAGYWLAAPCDRIVCAPSGSVGSIGVYIQHMNIAKMLADWGIENEFIKNGKFKTAGNSFESLSKDERQYLQDLVDERAGEFFAAVAKFRGVEESVVKGTDARVMRPTEALSLGLIDAAESPSTAVASFVAELGNDDPVTQDSQEEAMAEMTSEQMAELKNAERARIKGITTHAEAKGRENLAAYLAHDTDMSVDDAGKMLAAAPKAEEPKVEEEPAETAEEKKAREDKEAADAAAAAGDDDDKGGEGEQGRQTQFERTMDNGQHPNVGPDGKALGGGGGDAATANIDRILGAQSAATGRKFEQAKA